jgi:CheY-like chemotaxis protein
MTDSSVVLVVEDEALILLNTIDELEQAGLTVLNATTAQRALQLLETRPDITHLFSDIDLPGGVDGLALAETVRMRWPDVRILLTSGHMLPSTVPVPPGTVFFPKPYDLFEVRASLAA